MKERKFRRYELKCFIIDGIDEVGFYEGSDIEKRMMGGVLKGERVIGQ